MTRFLIFGLLGLVGSVLYTATKGAIHERKFHFTGEASLILFPVWGLIAIIYPLVAIHIGALTWYGRGAIYMLAFYIAQYLTGLGLTRLGLCPWRYPPGWSLNGLVRISDAPLWFAAGLVIEWIYPFVKTVSNAIG